MDNLYVLTIVLFAFSEPTTWMGLILYAAHLFLVTAAGIAAEYFRRRLSGRRTSTHKRERQKYTRRINGVALDTNADTQDQNERTDKERD